MYSIKRKSNYGRWCNGIQKTEDPARKETKASIRGLPRWLLGTRCQGQSDCSHVTHRPDMLKAFITKMSTAIISIYRPKDTLPEWARPKFSTELGLLDYVMMRFPLSPAFPHSLPPKPAEVSHPTQQNILLCLIPKTLRCIMVSLEANNTCPLTTFLSGVQHAVHTSALPGVLTVLSPVFSRTY